MGLNFNIPLLRRRAQLEFMKLGDAADRVTHAAGKTAEDASSRLPSVRLPGVDLGGAVKGARKTVDQARRALSDSGDAVARSAEQASARASHLGRDVESAIDDLRQLRITKKRGRDPWPGVALVTGVAAGLTAMFLLDPQDGRRRRALLRDKLGKWGRVAGREVRGTAVDLRNRSQGVIHEARSALGGGEDEGGQPTSEPATFGQPMRETGARREPVGVSVGEPAATPSGATTGAVYGDMTHEPGRANGRDTLG